MKMRKKIFQGQIVSLFLEKDKIGGKKYFREKVYLPDSVNIFPLIKEKVRFIKEKRWERKNKPIIKIISGLVNGGEKPLQAAKRELFEETGLKAIQWKKIFIINQEGTVHQRRHYYIVRQLQKISQREKNVIDFKDYSVDKLPKLILTEHFGITTSAVLIKLYNKLHLQKDVIYKIPGDHRHAILPITNKIC